MSLFYTSDTGSITNRFNQDMELIDMDLPLSLINTVVMIFVLIARAIFIAATGKYIGAALFSVSWLFMSSRASTCEHRAHYGC